MVWLRFELCCQELITGFADEIKKRDEVRLGLPFGTRIVVVVGGL